MFFRKKLRIYYIDNEINSLTFDLDFVTGVYWKGNKVIVYFKFGQNDITFSTEKHALEEYTKIIRSWEA